MILPVVAIKVAVPKLPTFALPVAFNVPAMLVPVVVNTTVFDTPPTLTATLPFWYTTTLLLPLDKPDVLIVTQLKLPLPLVCKY